MKSFCAKFCLFVLSLIVINHAFIWFYEIPKRKAIENGSHGKSLKWNDIKNPEKKYSAIILGSSRGYCAYNPEILDSIAGTKSYNMCTGSQNIIESYYMLKEIIKYQKPKFVIYETFLPSFRKTPDYFHVLENAEFMSINGKWDLVARGFGSDGIINILFPTLKYKTYLEKDLSDFFSSKGVDLKTLNWIKGYLNDTKQVDSTMIKNFTPLYNFENTPVSKENIAHYIKLLKELCKQNDIELICVRAPYPPSRLKLNVHDEVNSYFKTLYDTQDLIFYDFNYMLPDIYYDSDFSDYHHMNKYGADKVSSELANAILAK